jgi:hypothetical protein
MTMGFKADGDPPTGNPGVVEDSVEDEMDMEETTVPVVRKSVEKSGSRTGLSRLAHTSSKYKDKNDVKDKNKNKNKDKDNGQPTRVDDKWVGMNLEETPALVAGQSVEKSGIKSLQKKQSRSASAGTSRVATATLQVQVQARR